MIVTDGVKVDRGGLSDGECNRSYTCLKSKNINFIRFKTIIRPNDTKSAFYVDSCCDAKRVLCNACAYCINLPRVHPKNYAQQKYKIE